MHISFIVVEAYFYVKLSHYKNTSWLAINFKYEIVLNLMKMTENIKDVNCEILSIKRISRHIIKNSNSNIPCCIQF